jgi:hypothetical protein
MYVLTQSLVIVSVTISLFGASLWVRTRHSHLKYFTSSLLPHNNICLVKVCDGIDGACSMHEAWKKKTVEIKYKLYQQMHCYWLICNSILTNNNGFVGIICTYCNHARYEKYKDCRSLDVCKSDGVTVRDVWGEDKGRRWMMHHTESTSI